MSQKASASRRRADGKGAMVDVELGHINPHPSSTSFQHGALVNTVAFSSDGLASASNDTVVRLWKTTRGSALRDPFFLSFLHESPVRDVAFTTDGTVMASGSDNGTVLLWRLPMMDNTEQRVSYVLHNVGHISGLRFSPDGSRLAVAALNRIVYVLDVRSGQLICELRGHAEVLQCRPAFTPHGTFLLSGSADGVLAIWHIDRNTNTMAQCHSDTIFAIDFSPDGSRFVSGSADGTLYLGYIDTHGCARPAGTGSITGHRGAVYAVEFSQHGEFFASGSQDCTVRLWNNWAGQPIAIYAQHSDIVSDISISLDGTIVASASHDCSVRLWDTATHTAIGGPLEGHTQSVRSVAFSPDGRLLASASLDRTVRLWFLRDGDPDDETESKDVEQPSKIIVDHPSRSESPSQLLYISGVPQSSGGGTLYTSAQAIQQWIALSANPQSSVSTTSDSLDVSALSAQLEQARLMNSVASWLDSNNEEAVTPVGRNPTRLEEVSGAGSSTKRRASRGHASPTSKSEDLRPRSEPRPSSQPGVRKMRHGSLRVERNISTRRSSVSDETKSSPSPTRPQSQQPVLPEQTPLSGTLDYSDSRFHRVGRAVFSVLGKTGLDIAHEALAVGVDLLQFAPVPALDVAGHILLDIWDAFEQTQTNRSACERLATRCADILFSVREEVIHAGSGVVEELKDPIDRLNESFDKIREFTRRQIQLPFLKRYLGRDKILQEIEACHTDLSDARDRFGFSIQIRTLRLQSEAATRLLSLDSTLQTAKDRKQDEDKLRRLMRDAMQAKDDLAMLDLLQISRDEMPEAMQVLQRKLDQGDEGPAGKETLTAPSGHDQSKEATPGPDDGLDRQFMQTGVEALQRLSAKAGADVALPSWTITRYEVDCERRIGMGFFSDVYKGTWRERTVAIKVLTDTAPRETFVKEATIWKQLSHHHVLHLFGASSASSDPPWFFVSPYYDKGNVVTYLRNTPNVRNWRLRKMIKEVAKGMAYLHRENILHGDLKAANILVADDLHCVVSDFGQSEMKSEVCRLSGVPIARGTLRWQAPELLTGSDSRLTPQVDVYAYAICCSEILGKGALPWPLLDDVAVRHLVLDENKRPPLSGCRRAFRRVIESCWDRDPAARPSFAEVRVSLEENSNDAGNSGKKDK
ncbi:hypothetical protein EVG20_g9275 [Dentipellis fragilis]|uniref:Protein kinase domain-containing protein n=1 Tax=Dentipellis fragilis TaxID=205917 RepID=A0A4Y9XZQ0_9AGAM|nr:hypothetical protein EVG20_g9275 [Dentipellis fragilis]